MSRQEFSGYFGIPRGHYEIENKVSESLYRM